MKLRNESSDNDKQLQAFSQYVLYSDTRSFSPLPAVNIALVRFKLLRDSNLVAFSVMLVWSVLIPVAFVSLQIEIWVRPIGADRASALRTTGSFSELSFLDICMKKMPTGVICNYKTGRKKCIISSFARVTSFICWFICSTMQKEVKKNIFYDYLYCRYT